MERDGFAGWEISLLRPPAGARRWICLLGSWLALTFGPGAKAAENISDAPLAARSGPRGATMFAELASADTGVLTENNYDDPAIWTTRYADFSVGSVGTGVAIGDYDNDGRPDLFVVSKTGSCRLFRNLGEWKFEDVTEKAGVADHGEAALLWKQGATFVDVNNDGLLDLYVCRFNAPNLLYLNQGDGTFREEAAARGLAINDASVMAAFCDYDRDGWLDVFVQTNRPDSVGQHYERRNYLLHNNGDGTFTDVTARAGIRGATQGHSAIWWDYDGDGWPDLYVANDFTPADQLYHNNHDGTFTDTIGAVVPHLPFSSMGSDLGDVNNDGLIDLFVADMAATTHQKDQRTMANVRSLIRDPADSSAEPPFAMRNALFLNTGTGRMLEAAELAGVAATDWTWSVRLEDLDNDGRLDLHVTNGMYREPHNADLMARIASAESVAEKIRIERASPVLNESHLAFRNRGDLRFEDVSAAWGLDQKGVGFGAAFGDLDGDGDLDLVYANYRKGVTVLRNDSDTGHRVIVALRGRAAPGEAASRPGGARSNRFGVGAVVRICSASGVQVRQLVLARGYLSSSEPVLHFGLGDDSVIERLTVEWPSGRSQEFAHLAVDRKYVVTEPGDAPEPARKSEAISAPLFSEESEARGLALAPREKPRAETSASTLPPLRPDRRGSALAAGDLTGGGRDELVVGGTAVDPARRLARGKDGRFAEQAAPFAADPKLADGPVLIFDANGDGANDVLVTRGGDEPAAGSSDYQPALFFNDGHGALRPAPPDALPALPLSVGAAVASDFDHSGRLGLFLGARVQPGGYPHAPRSVLLANRAGKFVDVTDAVAPLLRDVGMVTAALWTDVDGDGWPDLLVAVEWGAVKYFHNRDGRAFEDRTDAAGFGAAGTGWWNSIAAADFNGDGRLDYVVGNVGLNTPYRGDAAHPALLYAGDFDGRGREQLIEAYFEDGKIYPRQTRRELGSAIPAVLARFPRTDAYARATLEEILGADKLAAAQRFAATELRSGVFLSQPDGHYRFEPLPRLAQIAPIEGIVTGDFDGDGCIDICAVQNSFAPVPSVGRFDGGLGQLLLGDGHGHFRAVPARDSGLIVSGDGKALAVLDLDDDGWPDLVVSRNNSSTLAFRNHGAPGRHSFGVRLRASGGNPAAIGTRLTVEFSDGTSEVFEIAAGSGYASQSSATAFFGWPDANPPRRLRVRWPTGATSEHPLDRPAGTLTPPAP